MKKASKITELCAIGYWIVYFLINKEELMKVLSFPIVWKDFFLFMAEGLMPGFAFAFALAIFLAPFAITWDGKEKNHD